MFGLFFPSPQSIARLKQYRREQFGRAVAWDEDKTKFAKELVLRADTFSTADYQLFDVEPSPTATSLKGVVISPAGSFGYANRVLHPGDALRLYQGRQTGEVFFDGEVTTPVLYRMNDGQIRDVWMSLTPAEVLTQRAGIRAATGKVLVGGLGLGYLLRKVAAKKSVKEIVLVERSQELLDWYGRALCDDIAAAHNKPITVICDDVLNHMGKHGEETRHLIDIWSDFPNPLWSLGQGWEEAIRQVRYFWGWGVLSYAD